MHSYIGRCVNNAARAAARTPQDMHAAIVPRTVSAAPADTDAPVLAIAPRPQPRYVLLDEPAAGIGRKELRVLAEEITRRVGGYVIGVGGFLGMGEHDVLVTPDKLKFSNEAMKASTADNTRANSNRPARDAKEVWYPDHAVMAATKDSLKALPEFKYSTYN